MKLTWSRFSQDLQLIDWNLPVTFLNASEGNHVVSTRDDLSSNLSIRCSRDIGTGHYHRKVRAVAALSVSLLIPVTAPFPTSSSHSQFSSPLCSPFRGFTCTHRSKYGRWTLRRRARCCKFATTACPALQPLLTFVPFNIQRSLSRDHKWPPYSSCIWLAAPHPQKARCAS